MTTSLTDLAIAEQVLGSLQQHRSRDRVEIVVDIGLDWTSVEPTLEGLIADGYVLRREIDGEFVYELAPAASSRSLVEIAKR